jgi:hypothetical protein
MKKGQRHRVALAFLAEMLVRTLHAHDAVDFAEPHGLYQRATG